MSEPTCVLITGAGGQLGRALTATAPTNLQCIPLRHAELDITDPATINITLDKYQPDAVINTAAYTAVDAAETDMTSATRLNATAPGLLAKAATARGIRMLHISTDFVFDGTTGRPYQPGDQPAPINAYGRSKYAGEQAVLSQQSNAFILRTAWLYGAHGRNFVNTMLRLMRERDRDTLDVVADQVGTPTSASSLAQALWAAVQLQASGIHHWTDAGVASWYDFAVAIAEEATLLGLLSRAPVVRPIRSQDYPTPAPRPAFSVLDKTATVAALQLTPTHWRQSLRAVLRFLAGRDHA